MNKKFHALRIVFMGTPAFAVASLDKLVKAGANIVGVVTAPDKQAGRGLQLQQSDVKKYATEHHLNVLQPLKLKDPFFQKQLSDLNADIQVVVAFRMLPESVWNMPPMGTINLHGSLLPQYRGAAPINWAIINGEKSTGVSTFKLQHEIDTGDILLATTIPIGDDETAGELHDKMKEIGASLLLDTLNGIAEGTLTETPQQQHESAAKEIKHAPKIFTANCLIDWHQSINQIYDHIRGLSPYPAAHTLLDNKTLKIFRAEKSPEVLTIEPGHYHTDNKTFLKFAGSDGYISIKQLQLEGKKRLDIKEFLRGHRFK